MKFKINDLIRVKEDFKYQDKCFYKKENVIGLIFGINNNCYSYNIIWKNIFFRGHNDILKKDKYFPDEKKLLKFDINGQKCWNVTFVLIDENCIFQEEGLQLEFSF